MANIQNQKFVSLGLQKTVSSKGVVSYHTHLDAAAKDNPILVLLHGYPQSSYMYGKSFDRAELSK
jgi:pimeloyl-ACP methyl ester carboxylesterase